VDKTLSDAQALEVGRRLDPQSHRIRFRANGTVVAATTPDEAWTHIELWDCWREAGVVRVEKVLPVV